MTKKTKREFQGFSQQTVDFFRGIKSHNNKPWFEAHRRNYTDFCLTPIQKLVYDLSPAMLDIDPGFNTNPAKMVSRIYRDIRFSKDKSPYKSRLWFTFRRPWVEWQDAPGYYFEVSYDSYGFGMGIYDMSPETREAFRSMLDDRPEEFLKATSFFRSGKNIFDLGGDRYKRPPKREMDKKLLDWYMMKNFYFYCERPVDNLLFSPRLTEFMIASYRTLAPAYKLLWKLKE